EGAEAELADVLGAQFDPLAALAAGQRDGAAEGGCLDAGGERGGDGHGEASLLIFPVGFRRDGFGTYRRSGLASRSDRGGLPELRRAVPSAPLDEQINMKL